MAYKSEAYLEGTILYIDGHVWANDVAGVDEALEILHEIKVPTAPKSVRVFTHPRKRRKQV